jgi:hypothetical protein
MKKRPGKVGRGARNADRSVQKAVCINSSAQSTDNFVRKALTRSAAARSVTCRRPISLPRLQFLDGGGPK